QPRLGAVQAEEVQGSAGADARGGEVEGGAARRDPRPPRRNQPGAGGEGKSHRRMERGGGGGRGNQAAKGAQGRRREVGQRGRGRRTGDRDGVFLKASVSANEAGRGVDGSNPLIAAARRVDALGLPPSRVVVGGRVVVRRRVVAVGWPVGVGVGRRGVVAVAV